MATIPQVATAMRTVLGPAAERAARESGFVRRASKLTGARFVQTLVFGWLAQPRASLSQLAQAAATLGVPISAQGLDERFGEASADCLRAVVEEAVQVALAADPVAVPVLRRFTAVAVQDCTTIALPDALAAAWPGCGGSTPTSGRAAVKLGVRLDLASGRLQGPYVEAGRTNDHTAAVAALPLPPGALWLADLGFCSLAGLAARDAQGSYFLSRWQPGTALSTPDGQRHELLPLLDAAAPVVDRPVRLGARHRLPARLLGVRVPQEVADQRRRRLRAAARDKGRAVSAARLALCAWTVLVTNVPPERLTVREALVLARARWQIELLFKLWKSHGRVDEWRTASPWRILTEVYAKLLAVIVQHWLVLIGCWRQPDRSMVKAAQAIQGHALHLAATFDAHPRLCRALQILARCLAAGRLDRRQAAPATAHLLLALETEDLA